MTMRGRASTWMAWAAWAAWAVWAVWAVWAAWAAWAVCQTSEPWAWAEEAMMMTTTTSRISSQLVRKPGTRRDVDMLKQAAVAVSHAFAEFSFPVHSEHNRKTQPS